MNTAGTSTKATWKAAERALFKRRVGAPVNVIVDAEGVELIDADGRRIIDACSGVGVTSLGYTAPAVPLRMFEQAERLQYVHGLRLESPAVLELADLVASRAPEGITRCYFVSGGSEAVESAIKLVRQYWLERDRPEKWRVIGRRPSYHGNTLGTLSAGWHSKRRARNKPLLLDFPHIEAPNSYRGCSECGNGSCDLGCVDALERKILEVGAESIGCFIVEPVAGAAGGPTVVRPDYFPAVREICRRHDILLVVDETLTGFGRIGSWFGIERFGCVPDVVTFGKGIGAGFAPLAGLAISEEIAQVFEAGSDLFEHNFTYAGHAVACAAGCAVIAEIEERGLIAKVRSQEGRLRQATEQLLDLPIVGDVRGIGYLLGIELVQDAQAKRGYPPQMRIAERAAAAALDAGVYIYYGTSATDAPGDFLLLMPPLVTPPHIFDEIVARLRTGLVSLEDELERA